MSANPRSIHDVDTTEARRARAEKVRRRGKGRKALVSATVFVAALGAGIGTGAYVSSLEEESALTTPHLPAGSSVDVFIDGWSLTTLGDTRVTAALSDGTVTQVRFSPVTGADLNALLATTPGVVRDALARQITADPTLECDSDGCRTSSQEVDPRILLLGGKSEQEKLLRGVGVTSGLHRASIAGVKTSTVLSADGYANLRLAVGTDKRDPFTGYGHGRYLVSAGLGRLFVTEPSWVGHDEARVAVGAPAGTTLPAGAAGQVLGAAHRVTATAGLGTDLDAATAWTDSQLTLATSPSQGCTAGILCYPGVLPVSETVVEPVAVTATAGPSKGVILLDDRQVTVDLPAAIRQVDVADPISGDVNLRFVTAALFSGSQVTWIDVAGLVAVDDVGEYSLDDVLANVRLSGLRWEPAE